MGEDGNRESEKARGPRESPDAVSGESGQFYSAEGLECFDADVGRDSAREIREYYVPDFSKWQLDDTYQVEFEKLLKALKVDAV